MGIVCLFFCPLTTNAQYQEANRFEYNPNYTELLITVYTEDGFKFDVRALISEDNIMFLNVEAIFNVLKIKCLPTLNGLKGFIENETNFYSIDYNKKQIKVGTKSINIEDHTLEELGVKYISAPIISQAFGITFTFNKRSLTAKLTASFVLPFMKQVLREKNRKNILNLQRKPSIIIDTIIPRHYNFFKFGSVDWGLNTSQGAGNNNTSINLGIGTELFFGEADFSMNYNTKSKFDINQLRYRWRTVNNDHKFIKQAQLGQISVNSISKLDGQLIGASINNSSTEIKTASGFYNIINTTEPNWMVELYINDVLIDYTQADPTGLYQFKVPIVYGYINTKLKFYGPLGEERSVERTLNTPYSLTASKTLEYKLSTAIVQDSLKSRFAKADFSYGITQNLTFNGGLEYLSSNPNGVFSSFANVNFQPYSRLNINLSYIPDKRLISLINLNLKGSGFLKVYYLKDLDVQTNKSADLKINFSKGFKANLLTVNYNRSMFESFAFNQVDFTFSSTYKKLSINSSTYMNWAKGNPFQLNTQLLLSRKLAKNLRLSTSTIYNLVENKFNNLNANIQTIILKTPLIANFNRDIESKAISFTIAAIFDLPFSRVGVSSSYNNNSFNFSEYARGSLLFGDGFKNVYVGKNSSIGKGGILLHPFLDLNENGKLDKGEKKVLLSSVKILGAKAVISKKDSIVRVFDLNAFVNYTAKFLDSDLNNIAWRFKHNTYKILVDPNQYKRVFIPVIPVGEIVGMVYLKKGKSLQGQARINIQIIDEKRNKVAEVLSEYDGYFTYLGLKPGKYTVRIDPEQLKSLNLTALPKVHQVTIKVLEYGDVIEDLDFTLSKKAPKKPKE